MKKKKRGFEAMNPQRAREIHRMGGKSAHAKKKIVIWCGKCTERNPETCSTVRSHGQLRCYFAGGGVHEFTSETGRAAGLKKKKKTKGRSTEA